MSRTTFDLTVFKTELARQGLTMAELSRKMGRGNNYVNAILNSSKSHRQSTLAAICAPLGKTCDELFPNANFAPEATSFTPKYPNNLAQLLLTELSEASPLAFAEVAGLCRSTVGDWFYHQARPTASGAKKVAEALSILCDRTVTIDEVFPELVERNMIGSRQAERVREITVMICVDCWTQTPCFCD